VGVPCNPLLAQVLPSPAEKQISPVELKDPLGEGHYAIADRIIWHYPSRILVRATGECFLFAVTVIGALYCRLSARLSMILQYMRLLWR